MKRTLLILATLLCTAGPSNAAARDADFEALSLARNGAAVEALARSRLAIDPLDEAALWYWAEQDVGDPRVRALLRKPVTECVAQRPRSARCHHVMGLVLTMDMMEGGLGGLLDLGKVRRHFDTAVVLEPQNFEMRRDLIGFYLEVPTLLGGSARRARALASDLGRVDAPRGALLDAAIAIHERDFPFARAALDSVRPAQDLALLRDLQAIQSDYGEALIDAEEPAKARDWFRQQVTADPLAPAMHVGLARAHAKLGDPRAAVAAWRRALALNPRLHVQFQLGEVLEAAGEVVQAVAAYRASLVDPAEHEHAKVARERLAALTPRTAVGKTP